MQSNQGKGRRRKGSSKQKDSRPSVKEKGLEETSGFLGVSYVKMTQKKKKKTQLQKVVSPRRPGRSGRFIPQQQQHIGIYFGPKA